MFAPENYIGFENMSQYLIDWSYRAYLAHLLEERDKDISVAFDGRQSGEAWLSGLRHQELREQGGGELKFSGEAWENHLKITRIDGLYAPIIYHCLLAKSLLKLETLVCSTDGKIMRPDDYVFIHQDRLDWVYPTWPIRETNELHRIFKLADERGFSGYDLSVRYCFLDHSLGILKLKNNSINGFKFSSHFGDEALADSYFQHQVKPFLGWAPVWNEDDLPDNFAHFLENLGVLREEWNVPALTMEKTGHDETYKTRGAKPTGAKAEFRRRYPNGKPDGLSADAIAAELTEAGFPISGRQVLNYAKEQIKV